MTDDDLQPAPTSRREHPIAAGLVALVVVAVVVGAVIGGGALVVTKALGLDGAGGLDAQVTDSQTLFLPDPTDISSQPNPGITLSGVPTSSAPSAPKTSKKPTKAPTISLSAGQTAVAPMQQIDLTGVYSSGEGAILRVQQFSGGAWTDFPVTASVSGGQFSTYIQAGAVGLNRFRMIDTDSGAKSNEVKVQIG